MIRQLDMKLQPRLPVTTFVLESVRRAGFCSEREMEQIFVGLKYRATISLVCCGNRDNEEV